MSQIVTALILIVSTLPICTGEEQRIDVQVQYLGMRIHTSTYDGRTYLVHDYSITNSSTVALHYWSHGRPAPYLKFKQKINNIWKDIPFGVCGNDLRKMTLAKGTIKFTCYHTPSGATLDAQCTLYHADNTQVIIHLLHTSHGKNKSKLKPNLNSKLASQPTGNKVKKRKIKDKILSSTKP